MLPKRVINAAAFIYRLLKMLTFILVLPFNFLAWDLFNLTQKKDYSALFALVFISF